MDQARLDAAHVLATTPIEALISLAGKTAVVTGAARGIGLAIAQRLAEAGAQVVMADVDIDAARIALAESAPALRNRLSAYATDMRHADQIAALAEHAAKASGRLDIWVNNAGVFPLTGPIAQAEDEVFARTLAINVAGPFAASREAARRMKDGGVILNIASIGGLQGQKFMTAYSASKHALVGMTRSLALELGASGIRVVAIAPGLVLTPGVEAHIARLREAGAALPRGVDETPIGRPCLPDDVARVALFAASDLAAMVTGAVIPVEGGICA